MKKKSRPVGSGYTYMIVLAGDLEFYTEEILYCALYPSIDMNVYVNRRCFPNGGYTRILLSPWFHSFFTETLQKLVADVKLAPGL